MNEAVLDRKIKTWEDQLLDLGKRNKMISFRESKRATLKILKPGFDELYQQIVVDEKELTFQKAIDRDSDVRVYSILSLLDKLSCPMEVNVGDIRAEGSLPEIKKTLKHLRSKARLALDEQGTNILYLVFGFIEWREKGSRNDSWVKSPLILVPVTLTLPSLNAQYSLQKHEDEVVVNPTLAYLFERDYGISLPEFDSDKDTLESFMQKMEALVDERGWRIVRECSMGLVSFLKISMYNDLIRNETQLKTNPIIRAFAGERNEVNTVAGDTYEFDHDACHAVDSFLVLDADSSQQDAIALSQKGVSFVMQGPPGTGKSQTITNIIAQALADGKKILFVSEKMAALDVVYRRLTDVHLADFCLSLHSHKANKKEILDQLGANLSLQRIKVKDEEIAKLTRLDMIREQLKAYVHDIHQTIMPLEMSLYEVYGAILELGSLPDIEIHLPDVDKLTKDDVNRLAFLVMNLDKAQGVLGPQWYKNPWQGVKCSYLEVSQKRDLQNKLQDIIRILTALEECKLVDKTLADILTVDTVNEIAALCEHARYCIEIPGSWFYRPTEQEERVVRVLREQDASIKALTKTLSDKYDQRYFDQDGQKILQQFTDSMNQYLRLLHADATPDDVFHLLDQDYQQIQILNENCQLLLDALNVLSEEYGLQLPQTFASVEIALTICDMLLMKRNLTDWYFSCVNIAEHKQYIDGLCITLKEYVGTRENLCEVYSEDILEYEDSTTLLEQAESASNTIRSLITADAYNFAGFCKIVAFDLDKIKLIEEILNRDTFDDLSTNCGLQRPTTVNEVVKQIALLQKVQKSQIVSSWKSAEARAATKQLLKALTTKTALLVNNKALLKQFFDQFGFAIQLDGLTSEAVESLRHVQKKIPEAAIVVTQCTNDDAYHLLNEIEQKAKRYVEQLAVITDLRTKYHIKAEICHYDLLLQVEALKDTLNFCNPCNAWGTARGDAVELYKKMVDLATSLNMQKSNLTVKYKEDVFLLDYSNLLPSFTNEYVCDKEKLRKYFTQYGIVINLEEITESEIILLKQADTLIEEATTIVACCNNKEAYSLLDLIDRKIDSYDRVSKEISSLRSKYQIRDGISDSELLAELRERRNAILECQPCACWTTQKEDAILLIGQVVALSSELRNQHNNLMEKYENTVFNIDYAGMLNRFKAEYTNFFKIFKSSYKDDIKQIRLVFKEVRKKITDDEIIELLQELRKYDENLEKYRKLSQRISDILNIGEYDIWYDWTVAKKNVEAFEFSGQIFMSDEAAYNFIAGNGWDSIYSVLTCYDELVGWFTSNSSAVEFFGSLYAEHETNTQKIRDALTRAQKTCPIFETPERYLQYMETCTHSPIAIQQQSFYKFFVSPYKKDREKIVATLKPGNNVPSDAEIITLLMALKQYHGDMSIYLGEASRVATLFDIEEYDIGYDWPTVNEQLVAFETISELFRDDESTYQFIIDHAQENLYRELAIYADLKDWFENNTDASNKYGCLYLGAETDTGLLRDLLSHAQTMLRLFNTPDQYLAFLNEDISPRLVEHAIQQATCILETRDWLEEKSGDILFYTGVSRAEYFTDWANISADLELFCDIVSIVGDDIGYALAKYYKISKETVDKHLDTLQCITEISKCAEAVCYTYVNTETANNANIDELITSIRTIVINAKSLKAVYEALSVWCPEAFANRSVNAIIDDLYSVTMYQRTRTELPQIEKEAQEKIGADYKGIYTDWTNVYSNVDFCDTLFKLLQGDVDAKLVYAFVNAKPLYSDEQVAELHLCYHSVCEAESQYPALCNYSDMCEKITVLPSVISAMGILIHTRDAISETAFLERNYSTIIEDLQSLAKLQEILTLFQSGILQSKKILPAFMLEPNVDWDNTVEVFRHLRLVKRAISSGSVDPEIMQLVSNSISGISALDYYSRIEKLASKKSTITDFTGLFSSKAIMESFNLAKLNRRVRNCNDQFATMDAWIDLRDCKKACVDNGLEEFIVTAEDTYYPAGRLNDVFMKSFYYEWFEKICAGIESVSTFRVRTQESRVETFRELDAHQLPVDQMRIREKLIREMPSRHNFGRATDEMSILLHELNKKRKIMPLRKLFRTIPNLLLKLKPCLMMSPLSVSYFLEAETYRFDMVIFDEASQIFPQDAIGAIFRAKQVIIAGDSKQLPPTNFFSASTSNDADFDYEDDEEEEVNFDSILEEASNSLPNRSLLWHYRSRFEELISFSNQQIYQNNLITFPSSTIHAKDTGVEYVYVQNGVYENRCNRAEAQEIVRMVAEHIRMHPDRSLGIIAFSESQQSVIEEEINKFRTRNPFNERFFDEDKDEPFFVKNLENVQGDERDTIIFSICYAKNAQGRMYMRFGPLGHQGGERRLNVAITRAKHNVKLVGSILPEDIDLSKTHSEGVRMLRTYISFAMNGSSALPKAEKKNNLYDIDTFSEEVGKFLTSRGCSVQMNVGSSDYTIDIAVEHPKKPGQFIAGIECDGSSYYMARTVRDREHLRTAVLEQMGWKMYRVWSTEWIRNPEAEKERLMNFIRDALLHHGEKVPDTQAPAGNAEELVGTEVVKPDRTTRTQSSTNPYNLPLYEEGKWWNKPTRRGRDNLSNIADSILAVVKVEQPMHMELMYKRVGQSFTAGKATQNVRYTIDQAIKERMQGVVVIEDQFIRLTSLTTVQARRSRLGDPDRTIEYISIPEIAAAMEKVLVGAYGMDRSVLCSEAAKVFGFERTGAKIKQRTNEAVDYLVRTGKVSDYDDKIQLLEG